MGSFHKKRFSLILLLLFLKITPIRAGVTFEITNHFFEDAVPESTAQEIEMIVQDMFQPLVEDNLSQINYAPFLRAMGDASANSAHATRSNYASSPDVGLVGIAFGLALNPGGKSLADFMENGVRAQNSELPPVGVGLSLSWLFGLNLGYLNNFFKTPDFFKRTDLYISTFYISSDISPSRTSANMFNLGLNLQYKLVTEKKYLAGLIKWTGVRIGSGINYHSYSVRSETIQLPRIDLSYQTTSDGAEDFSQTCSVEDALSNTLCSVWDGDVNLGARIKTFIIPTDISTGIRLFYFFSLYFGLGGDFVLGTSKLEHETSGSVETRDIISGDPLHRADVSLTVEESTSPTFFNLRTFLGVQIEVWVLKVFAQATYETMTESYGISFGTRVAY